MNKQRTANLVRVQANLSKLGFSHAGACQLIRIERTLQRWAERECNGEIERDEESGKPYLGQHGSSRERLRHPVPDREAGALRRLAAILAPHKRRLVAYHQGDPRGCALYLVKRSDLRTKENQIVRKAIDCSGERMHPITQQSSCWNGARIGQVVFNSGVHDSEEAAALAYLRGRKLAIPGPVHPAY